MHIIHALAETTSEAYSLSPIRRQTIIETNAGLLSIRPSRTNFSEIFSFMKMHLKISSAIKWKQFLRYWPFVRGIQ